jgi:hypothetical protein
MSDQSQHPTSNGADTEQPQSLREIAEAAYDSVLDQADVEDGVVQPDSSGQPRDERGRFIPKSPEGEAAPEQAPSPSEETQETDQEHPAPAQPGQAAQPPSNWSAEDRANFEKLPPEGQQFLLRRHSEMESDYQKRVQATTLSNQFVNAVAPVFNDSAIAASLQGRSPVEAIHQWAFFHKRAIDPNPNNRIDLLFELADRMQLDPAVVFGRQAQVQAMAFTPEELANPAFKKFADHIGMLTSRLQASESMWSNLQQGQQEAAFRAKRSEIDAFAATKNTDGTPAYPLFDAAMPIMMEIFRADPTKSMADCYHEAVAPFEAANKAKIEQQQSLARAQAAARGNVRGTTAPVSKPAPPAGPRGIRQVLEESADEVGF